MIETGSNSRRRSRSRSSRRIRCKKEQLISLIELMSEPPNFNLKPLVMGQDILKLKLEGLIVPLNSLGLAAGSFILVPNRDLFGRQTKLVGKLLLALAFKLGVADEARLQEVKLILCQPFLGGVLHFSFFLFLGNFFLSNVSDIGTI